MTIRPYSPSDDKSIITLLRLNTPEYFAPEEEADLRDYFANHIDHYFVVEDNGSVIGCGGINFSQDGKKAVLSWDIIHPDYQGKGVGRQLILHRLDTIKQMDGIENISVRTSQLVYKFYEKFGFELKESVKNFWAEGIDMYRMEIKQ
jgi:ribosomal-protein-alanine N-acetyltransferase